MTDATRTLQGVLDYAQSRNQIRKLTHTSPLKDGEIEVDGKLLVNFASNDYLGLSKHPLLKQRACQFAEAYGVGSTSSRLLAGNMSIYQELERKVADMKGTEDALIFSTGFQANSTVISSLAGAGCLIASDKYNHSSIAQALRISGSNWFRYKHLDLEDLETQLHACRAKGKLTRGGWIVTESLFSMDGDAIDADALTALSRRLQTPIYVDEAHSIGISGHNGMGLRLGGVSDIYFGTFGKAFGSFGAYLAGPKVLKDFLINSCPGLIYSTALPPPVLGAIQAALELIPKMGMQRKQLQEKSNLIRAEIARLGLDRLNMQVFSTANHIIPIAAGSNLKALKFSDYLRQRGIFAPAIRPPTVPEGQARIRLSIISTLKDEHIERLMSALGALAKNCGKDLSLEN